jgi:hypothetical protein
MSTMTFSALRQANDIRRTCPETVIWKARHDQET